ncbi:MAG TPA: DUF4258 domain-containing protein [Flavisolibacter sp.]
MKRRNVTVPLFLLLLIFLVFLVRRWNEPKRKEAFDRDPPQLQFSSLALCQMACRGIRKTEIEEIMKKGVINFNRSDRRRSPCPSFALQGLTASGKSLAIVFAQCPLETTVMACYNPKDTTRCDCPLTENKGGH